ncbi:hypothetical protein LARI1_G005243 [Lachnellula arida]|uniref:BTB domain-containing protein n=1 Tax=Lachnellula arida TaxID=1316785 RepID=A0A8T9BDR6_9HELO|nr:hypothetical protein LARI1_G005243 [Lachnellula arida]
MSYEEFVCHLLPFYTSPLVTIRIDPLGDEYKLPRALLCKQSPYFRATFEGNFKESEEQLTTLSAEEGLVSLGSFHMLVQWIYLGRIIFVESIPEEQITAIIEFLRIADMCGVTGMESLMADHIKEIILANPPKETVFATPPDKNTHFLTSHHIKFAVLLPKGHAVRKMLASAAVKGYLLRDRSTFFEEIRRISDSALDLLGEVNVALESLEIEKRGMTFEDPISGQRVHLKGGF